MREVCLEAYAHQDVPFERLVEELQPERTLGETPLFQAMFACQNAPAAQLELPGLTLTPWNSSLEKAKFDLSVVVTEASRELQVTFNYNADIFSEKRISRMTGHFNTLLKSIIEHPAMPISRLQMMTKEEGQAIITASAPAKSRRRHHR